MLVAHSTYLLGTVSSLGHCTLKLIFQSVLCAHNYNRVPRYR